MARLTQDGQAVVIRLVYDGPPRSGKTTSLRGLGKGMARSVFSAAEEAGRTLYFDWLEYVGGSFDGIPIQCQILSVPGQAELAARRQALLADADAVVFVLNSTPEQLPEAAAHLRDLQAGLAKRPSPQPGIVVQANYRDRPDAVPLAELGKALGLDGLALVESVATESQGLREAFVLSVRLALERVRELLKNESLQSSSGTIDAPEALLAWLQGLETVPAAPTAGGNGDPAVLRAPIPAPIPAAEEPPLPSAQPSEAADSVPRLPDSSVPIGRVWPPIDGRLALHSAARPGARPQRARDGSWRFQTGEWHFHSALLHEFDHLEDGKQELLGWAQQQAGGLSRLSPQRCLVLADTGQAKWRLWQVVCARESLRQRLRGLLRETREAEAESLAGRLSAIVLLLFEARRAFAAAPQLPCSLDLIGDTSQKPAEPLGPQYIGLLPPRGWTPSQDEIRLTPAALVCRELQPLVEAALQERPETAGELRAVLSALSKEGLLRGGAAREARVAAEEALAALLTNG